LRCGILAHEFARARCSSCGYDFLVAFSCKGRGACPSCNAKRMAETAAHLVGHVIPHVPVRQFVLSVPKRLRPYLHHRPRTASAVLHILLRALQATLREACPTAPRTAALTHELLEGLQQTVRKRVLRHRVRHGLLEPHDAQDMLGWDQGGGFSLNGSVRIEAIDRKGLERLIRYCARPPFALDRLHLVDGRSDQIRPSRWAALLARIYEVFPLICPTCQTPLTFITLPPPPTTSTNHPSSIPSTPSPFLKTTSIRAGSPDLLGPPAPP
jgi:hypothetical protein